MAVLIGLLPDSIKRKSCMEAKRLKQSALTLIELLVVLAIIAVCIALLLPAIQSIRRAASQLVTVNRFHQLGRGMHSYLSAQAGRMPGYFQDRTPLSTDPRGSWSCPIEVILPHVDSKSTVMIGQRNYFRAVINPSDPSLMLAEQPFPPNDVVSPVEFTTAC